MTNNAMLITDMAILVGIFGLKPSTVHCPLFTVFRHLTINHLPPG